MLITHARTAHAGHHTHTPGPWHVQGRYIVPADDGPSIGSAIALKAPSLRAQPDYDAQAHVNARLMAAAPCMYDALVETIKLLQDPEGDESQADQLEDRINKILASLEQPL